MKLSHLDAAGRARMVDVGDKPVTVRTAVAEGTIRMAPEAFRLVADQAVAKGDVLAVSEVAGTLAAKRTAELIPLCHPLGLDHVEVEATLDEALPGVRVRAAVGGAGLVASTFVAVAVPAARLIPKFHGVALWVAIATTGIACILGAATLERGRAGLKDAVRSVAELMEDWE